MNALITKKIGMTTLINDEGILVPMTLLSIEKNQLLGHRTIEKDGYNALIIGGGTNSKLRKSIAAQFSHKAHLPKVIKEYRVSEIDQNINVGDLLKADVFSLGDIVDVTGVSKGKGWAGTIKRHNFHRGRKTHGGRSYRRPGSIGSMYPQHILKGKKMAGRMGHDQVTIKNLKIVHLDAESNVIGVSGAVPGPKKSQVMLKSAKSTRPKQFKKADSHE